MRDVISQHSNGFETLDHIGEGSQFLSGTFTFLQVLLDSVDTILEVLFSDRFKLIGGKIVFQKDKNEIVQRSVIQKKVSNDGRPIKSGRHY